MVTIHIGETKVETWSNVPRYETLAQAMSDYSPFGPNHGTYACDGSEMHPWGLYSYSPCMSLAETCIVLEHCPDAKEHDDHQWTLDLFVLSMPGDMSGPSAGASGPVYL